MALIVTLILQSSAHAADKIRIGIPNHGGQFIVKFLPTGAAAETRLAAMKQRLIVATIVGVPGDLEATKLGFHVLANAYELFSYPDAGLTASLRRIKERPDEVKRVIRAGIKANRYTRSEREGTIRFLTEWQKVSRDNAVRTYDAIGKLFSEDGSVPVSSFFSMRQN